MFCRIPLHPLESGKFAMVDKEDYALVSQYKWYYLDQGRNEYAQALIKGKNTRMHRLILGAVGKTQVDHISGNGLNNCRSNLRLCDNTQNQQNARKTLRKRSRRLIREYASSECRRGQASTQSSNRPRNLEGEGKT